MKTFETLRDVPSSYYRDLYGDGADAGFNGTCGNCGERKSGHLPGAGEPRCDPLAVFDYRWGVVMDRMRKSAYHSGWVGGWLFGFAVGCVVMFFLLWIGLRA